MLVTSHFYPKSFRYVKYHGADRRALSAAFGHQDVVLTTYGTVMAERRGTKSILHKVHWYRLVLDEGKLRRKMRFHDDYPARG
jgi:SNF2 family DNA or RNA helicase